MTELSLGKISERLSRLKASTRKWTQSDTALGHILESYFSLPASDTTSIEEKAVSGTLVAVDEKLFPNRLRQTSDS